MHFSKAEILFWTTILPELLKQKSEKQSVTKKYVFQVLEVNHFAM